MYPSSERTFIDVLRDNQKTLYLWGILILVTLTGIFILISIFRPGGDSNAASATPAPSAEGLNLMGKNVKDEGVVKGAQILPPQTQSTTKPKASAKATPKPSATPAASPSSSPTSTPTPTPTPQSSTEPTPTPAATPTPTPTTTPTPTPEPTPSPSA